jgi:hypothetical protein
MRTGIDKIRLEAAQALLDRGYGRVTQAVWPSGPLVNINLPGTGGHLTPDQAFRAMLEGSIPADGNHPAFLEQQSGSPGESPDQDPGRPSEGEP